MPLLGSHFMILLGGMSEKTRNPLSLSQQQPSAQSKPSPRTSIFASAGTSLSNAGSSRSMEPMVFVWAKEETKNIATRSSEPSKLMAWRNMVELLKKRAN